MRLKRQRPFLLFWAEISLLIYCSGLRAQAQDLFGSGGSRQTCQQQLEGEKAVRTQQHGGKGPTFLTAKEYQHAISPGRNPPWVDCISACLNESTKSGDKRCWAAKTDEPTYIQDTHSIRLPDCHKRLGDWRGSKDWEFVHENRERRFLEDVRKAKARGPLAERQVIIRYERERERDCAAELDAYNSFQKINDKNPNYPECHARLGNWPRAREWQRVHDDRERQYRADIAKRRSQRQPSPDVQREIINQEEEYYASIRRQDCADEKSEYDRWKAGGLPPSTAAEEDRRYIREKKRIEYEREIEYRYHTQNLRRFKDNGRLLGLENQRHDEQEAQLDEAAQANESQHGKLSRKFGGQLSGY